jgi:hypothetical protein
MWARIRAPVVVAEMKSRERLLAAAHQADPEVDG